MDNKSFFLRTIIYNSVTNINLVRTHADTATRCPLWKNCVDLIHSSYTTKSQIKNSLREVMNE